METLKIIHAILEKMVYVILPFFVCMSAILLFEKIAPAIGYTDKPTSRKQHIGNVPVVGGIAIYVAFAISIAILRPDSENIPILVFSLLLIILGVLDDYFDIRSSIRFALQATIIFGTVVATDIIIVDLGTIFPNGNLLLNGPIAVIFTLVCATGVINSINMIDGADGLSGSLLFISFFGLALIGWITNVTDTASLALVLCGAILAFLCFNARIFVVRARIFLGDSGTMFLGFVLFYCFARMSQGSESTLSAIAAGWIFGLPLIDTISVIVRRVANGQSPFKAGRDHLHHKLLLSGVPNNKVVLIMVIAHTCLVAVGLLINQYRFLEFGMFWLFVVTVVAYHYLLSFALNRFFGLHQGEEPRSVEAQ